MFCTDLTIVPFIMHWPVMYNWETLTANHQGGTRACRTPVSQGDELNTFNLNSRGLLIVRRWGTSAVSSTRLRTADYSS